MYQNGDMQPVSSLQTCLMSVLAGDDGNSDGPDTSNASTIPAEPVPGHKHYVLSASQGPSKRICTVHFDEEVIL